MKRLPFALLFVIAALATAAEKFPTPYDSEKDTRARPLSPEEAALGFDVPKGFKVSVFAAEPDVMNPIAMSWDTKGRLWIAENFTYAERPQRFDLNLRDRVLIFEDRDGDGKPEKRTVFLDDAQRLTSLAVGLGGVWLMCPPQLLFVPDRNGDDKPDGPPEVILDGFDIPRENYHNFANGLKWGPDGWLYGRCGASCPGKIRRPDEPLDAAIPLAGTMWRYHPTRKVFEALTHGCTNPWGHDWDANGELFFTNTVNGHLWHMIPGAHYRRPHTIDPNPLVYEPIEMIADHWHWSASKTEWVEPYTQKNIDQDKFGGGAAHCGAMIYQGNMWPKEYQGKLLTLNFHGRRANVETIERSGSGYIARHNPDMLKSNDLFFRGMDLDSGPDGSVYFIDWSDIGECHENTGVHRNSGRIYRVTYDDVKPTPTPDLTKLQEFELRTILFESGNAWRSRMILRALVDRFSQESHRNKIMSEDIQSVDGTPLQATTDLKSMWLAVSLRGSLREDFLTRLASSDEHVRSWAIRLISDSWPLDTVMSVSRSEEVSVSEDLFAKFLRMAREDKSALVRVTLASTLQRLPVKHRPALAAALLAHEEDAADANIPFMIWYGLIPVAHKNPEALVPLAAEAKIPAVRVWTARRFGEVYTKQPALLDSLLAATASKPESVRREVLNGMTVGLAGQWKATAPAAWKSFTKTFTGDDTATMQSKVQALDVIFGDGRALDEVRKLALDAKADMNLRKNALHTLIEAKPDDLRKLCESLLKVRFLNALALQGLTRFDDPAIGKLIAASYRNFHQTERPAVLDALASRPEFAVELLSLIAAGTLQRSDLSALHVRQILGFKNPELTKRLTEVWGELRESPRDKADLIAKLKGDLSPARLAAADKSRGRSLFSQSCASCHRLFGTGGEVGPDLTGAGRKDIDYLLSNIVDPSAVVNKDFTMTVLSLADGRSVSGIVMSETDTVLSVQTPKERVAIAKADVEKRTPSTLSLMPDAILQPLTREQIADLVAYLTTDGQVELKTVP